MQHLLLQLSEHEEIYSQQRFRVDPEAGNYYNKNRNCAHIIKLQLSCFLKLKQHNHVLFAVSRLQSEAVGIKSVCEYISKHRTGPASQSNS